MATSKEQLLQYFQGLDISTLEKLQKYSQLFIIPEEDMLINATMYDMVEKAHTIADALFPEWTDRSKSDFGEFLVELFALFSEKDFWYINAFANEGILRKMRSYSNVFSMASSIGYEAATCKGAYVQFHVTFDKGSEVTYERGDLIIEAGGYKYSNDAPFTLDASNTETSKTLQLYEGDQIIEEITYNGYNVFLRKKNIDIDSIAVSVNNITYTQVRTFGNSSADSHHFMVLPEDDGSCVIYFGNNGFGVQPSIGTTVSVEYRTCNGSAGNIIRSGEATINDSLSDRKAISVYWITNGYDGRDAETMTSIKEKAPLVFNTKRSAINETIAQQILNSFSFVYRSKVVVIGSEVVYRIIPTSGNEEPSSAELNTIRDEFHPYIMAGFSGAYTTNTYRNLVTEANPSATSIIIEALILSGYDAETISSGIRQIIDDVTNPLIDADYGGSFNKNDMDILIRSSINGVQNVTFKIAIGATEQIMPDVTLGDTEIFRKIDQNDLIIRTIVV